MSENYYEIYKKYVSTKKDKRLLYREMLRYANNCIINTIMNF